MAAVAPEGYSRAPMRLPLTLSLLATLACVTAAPGPADTTRAYAEALREGRTVDAWRLLSLSAREGMSYEQFERSVRERPDEVRALAESLGAVRSDDGVTARLDLPDGETISLRSEGGRWRLDPAALDFYPQNTPRQTLRSFVRAFRRGRWPVLVGLASREVRARLEGLASTADAGAQRSAAEALREAWSGAEASATAQRVDDMDHALTRGYPIEVMGERATMTYGAGAECVARLVREEGRWFIAHTD